MTFKYIRNRISRRIEDYAISTMVEIPKHKMTRGIGLFNNKCHLNAVDQVARGKADGVVSCICVEADYSPILHFINTKKTRYVDNTLGWQYAGNRYFIIKVIPDEELYDIRAYLEETRKILVYQNSNWLERLLVNNTIEDII